VEDASVLEIGDLGVGVKSALDNEALACVGGHGDVLADAEVSTLHIDAELFCAVEAEVVSTFTSLELHREDSHADKVRSVDTLVGLSDDGLDTLEVGALSRPIAGRAGSVLLSSKDDGLLTISDVLVGSIKNGHFFSGGDVDGGGSDLVNHLVDQTHVSESASSHNSVVASPGAVGVEVLGSDSALSEVDSCRGALGDLTGG